MSTQPDGLVTGLVATVDAEVIRGPGETEKENE